MLNKNFYLISIISAVFAISFWIGFKVNLLPAEASINAPIYDELFKILFIIGLIIFIVMTIAVIYSLFKFRKRIDQLGDGIALEGNLSLEIVWTIIPSIIVLIIGLYSYNIYDRMGGMKELIALREQHPNDGTILEKLLNSYDLEVRKSHNIKANQDKQVLPPLPL